ncbi:MAG: lipocalin-like domain-containing protein [Pseudomonadota bacterium]
MTRIVVKCWVPFICALILHSISVTCPSIAGGDFKQALPGYKFRFPQDHFSHPDFKLEWWYYTGNLHTAYGKGFGYELTFFRVGLALPDPSRTSRWAVSSIYLAHLALTDKSNGRFFYRERINRGSLGQAGAATDRYHVWIDDWQVRENGNKHTLAAGNSQLGINLEICPVKSPVIHGENGVSQKAESTGNASHYYSLTRMVTKGVIRHNGSTHKVTGPSWMDHEFGSNQLTGDQAGWDWFGLQLDNRHELMLYVMRQKDGSWNPVSSGTLVFPDSRTRHLGTGDFKIQKKGEWRSPHSGTVYPAGWTVTVPSEEILLEIMPALADQELVTENSARVTYWEGSVNIKGRMHRKSLTGQGYVELTGYAPGGIGPALRKE